MASDEILISQHDDYEVRFDPGTSGDTAALRFFDLRGKLTFSILLAEPLEQLRCLQQLLRQAAGDEPTVAGAPVGWGRRMLLRLLGRSIDFAAEFAVVIERSTQSLFSGLVTSESVHSTRCVLARMRGWSQPCVLFLNTIVRRTEGRHVRKNWRGCFGHKKLPLGDCRRLADGLDQLLAACSVDA